MIGVCDIEFNIELNIDLSIEICLTKNFLSKFCMFDKPKLFRFTGVDISEIVASILKTNFKVVHYNGLVLGMWSSRK